MDNKKPQTTQQPKIVRTLKQGPIHLVYVGQKHIGNIVQPVIGGSRKRVKNFMAMSRELKKQSNHPDKKTALTWLTAKTGVSTKMAENFIQEVIHNRKEQYGDNWLEHLNETAIDYEKMKGSEIHHFFHNLYNSHLKTGMAPSHFKSPMHLASIEERNKKLPEGSLTKHVVKEAENEPASNEGGIEGQTPYSRLEKSQRRKITRTIKKDADDALYNIPFDTNKVAEAFYKVYNAAIQKEDLFDKDKNLKDKNAGPPPQENAKGDIEVSVKRTETGSPGDVIEINPKLKMKPTQKDMPIKAQHKKTADPV